MDQSVSESNRVDTIEKFWAMVGEMTKKHGRYVDDGTPLPEGTVIDCKKKLSWEFDDGKWIKLFGGTPDESNWWKWRELLRGYDAMERDEPWATTWHDELNPTDETRFHFVHVSASDNMMVAYTPDEDKGKRDIQVRLAPGKYLTKYYKNTLSEAVIRNFVDKHRNLYAPIEFKIAVTPEEATKVYEKGPGSCMGKPASHFETPYHPAALWGGGEAGVAYIVKGENITARAVVDTKRKRYVRCYGDITLMDRELKKAGYKKTADFAGLCVPRVEWMSRTRFIIPYLDGDCQTYVAHPTHLEVKAGGKYATNQGGWQAIDKKDMLVKQQDQAVWVDRAAA